MTDYVPFSGVGWLDLDEAASKRIGELIRALQEPGTLDPLGLGTVRDAFSEALAPGTSTIQTRLRYFLFVPWICRQIERDNVQPGRFLERLHEDESRLISCLRHLGPNNGVQGYNAGEELKRMPSTAYWGGLRSWGIRRLDWSIAEYARQLPLLRRRLEADDDSISSLTVEMWSVLPATPPTFLEEDVDFRLTLEEASFLVDQIRQAHPRSLLAAACAAPEVAAGASWPWEVDKSLLEKDLKRTLEHARNFSEVTLGPQVLYNLMVAERAEAELDWEVSGPLSEATRELSQWAEEMAARQGQLRQWVDHLAVFWTMLTGWGASIRPQTRGFITEMLRAAVADPHGFTENKRVRRLIVEREVDIKGPRARLESRAALIDWRGQSFGGQLSYRWPTCVSYLQDLAEAGQAGV